MRLGFYSEIARRDIAKARAFVTEHGYGATANEIRQCRQHVMDLHKSPIFGTTINSLDFFSISACRDLLFHVQEHVMLLTDVDTFLRENNLTFLGFEIDRDVLHAYKQRFPYDPAATNLGQWQTFENETPACTSFGFRRQVKCGPRQCIHPLSQMIKFEIPISRVGDQYGVGRVVRPSTPD